MSKAIQSLKDLCFVLFAAAVFLGLPACGGGGSSGGGVGEACASFDRAARRCDIAQSGGQVGGYCGEYQTNTAYTACLSSCIDSADCSDVEDRACSFSRSIENLNECTRACFDAEDYQCPDGEYIRIGYLCDQDLDCNDGSDEFGCDYADFFECGNGEPIVWSWQCDGVADCNDGSDEHDCANRICPRSEVREDPGEDATAPL